MALDEFRTDDSEDEDSTEEENDPNIPEPSDDPEDMGYWIGDF